MAKRSERANRTRARAFAAMFREALDRRGLSVRAFCALAADRGEPVDERTARDVLAANRLSRERTWHAIANALGWPQDAVKAFRQGEIDADAFTHQIVVGVIAKRVEQTAMSNREIDALAAAARQLAERLTELAEQKPVAPRQRRRHGS
jgi:formate-dependent phosphoribosylglycinamide formyltransferase (GAR transformylase)